MDDTIASFYTCFPFQVHAGCDIIIFLTLEADDDEKKVDLYDVISSMHKNLRSILRCIDILPLPFSLSVSERPFPTLLAFFPLIGCECKILFTLPIECFSFASPPSKAKPHFPLLPPFPIACSPSILAVHFLPCTAQKSLLR